MGVHSPAHRIQHFQWFTWKVRRFRPQKSQTAADRRTARNIKGLARAVVVTAANRRRPPHAAIANSAWRTIFFRISDLRPY